MELSGACRSRAGPTEDKFGEGGVRRMTLDPPWGPGGEVCHDSQAPKEAGSVAAEAEEKERICYLPCAPCLYTTFAKELLRPTVGLLCPCQGLWIRTRKVLCCPRWRTFRTQRYSKVLKGALLL